MSAAAAGPRRSPASRAGRWVIVLGFAALLAFPFYWMAITTFKPNEELLSREGNPFWVIKPTLAHFHKLLFETAYPEWLWNTVIVSVVATFAPHPAHVLRPERAPSALMSPGLTSTGMSNGLLAGRQRARSWACNSTISLVTIGFS